MSLKPVVSIRPLQESDAEAFFRLVEESRSHLERWLPWVRNHISVQASRRHISAGIVQQALRNGGQWGVFVGSQLAGEVCLHWIQWQHRSSSLGYWIGSPFLRQGLAMEACSSLLQIAFVEYDLHRLELSIATENSASLAVARKLGFIPEGVQRQSEWIADRYYDHQLLGLLRSEYSDGSCGNQIHGKWDDCEAGKVYY